MSPAQFQYHRAIIARPGPCQLELTDDVLDATRPSAPDLRILGDNGQELPFAMDTALQPSAVRLTPKNVATTAEETTAMVDRGEHASWADELDIEVKQAEFLKPVVVEASDDRAAWARIAAGAIFGVAGARSTALHFAPNDRRYLRISFDDRNGPRLAPVAFTFSSRPTREPRPTRTIDVDLVRATDAELGFVTYALTLPARNLPLVSIRLAPSDPIFARKVRVFERGFFRDEASRRLLGEATIVRSGGHESSEVALMSAVGRQLELDIERTDGPPLAVSRAAFLVRRPALLFFAPAGPLELHYGAPDVPAPRYDLAAALSAGGSAPAFAQATLGSVGPQATPEVELAAIRGAAVTRESWKEAREVRLPERGGVAYLDLPEGDLSDVRLVDGENRQVPYVIESTLRHESRELRSRTRQEPATTVVTLDGFVIGEERLPLEALELRVTAPPFFARDATVVETLTDARGPSGALRLGYGHLVKSETSPSGPLRIVVDRPKGSVIDLRIDDGDNAPLTIADVTAWGAYRRIDFAFRAGERLTLLRKNPLATAPRYDLQLLATRILSAPAERATVGPVSGAAASAEPVSGFAKWLWVPLTLAALALLLALRRTLRA